MSARRSPPAKTTTVIVTKTTTLSCHAPVPISAIAASAISTPIETPSASWTARRAGWPSVAPMQMTAETGAKNGRW